MGLPPTIEDSDPRLQKLTPSWKVQIRGKAKELLIEEEVRRRKYVLIEGCIQKVANTMFPEQSR